MLRDSIENLLPYHRYTFDVHSGQGVLDRINGTFREIDVRGGAIGIVVTLTSGAEMFFPAATIQGFKKKMREGGAA